MLFVDKCFVNYTPNDIIDLIEWELKHGCFKMINGFYFRPQQKKIIADILYNILNKTKESIVLDAPTGSGKSLIAMFCSKVLSRLGLTGYIVTSNTELQRQYMKDVEKYKLGWQDVMGVDNYTCSVNDSKFSLGECRMRGLSYEQAEKLHCFENCGYLQSRKKAKESPVAIMNYSYYLIQMNFVMKEALEEGKQAPFEMRDFVFFDEAHKIEDIVQSHFAPRIDYNFYEKIESVNEEIDRLFKDEYDLEDWRHVKGLIIRMHQIEDKEELYQLLEQFETLLSKYVNIGRKIASKTDKKFNKNIQIPSEWKKMFFLFDLFKDMLCKVEDYTDMLLEMDISNLLKNPQPTHMLFNLLSDQQMLTEHLHKKSKAKVFMSATLGSVKHYTKNCSILDFKELKVNPTFNYEESPIFVFNLPKLTYQEKIENYKIVAETLDKILEKLHPNDRGIVHTTSYEFVDKILNHSKHKKRFFNYLGSKQKKESLENFYNSDNGVLIGPSLLEGLDLKDDKSRFQIFFKMPYANITDKFVAAKTEKDRSWYNWKSSIAILQGIGRSIRSDEDWAKTYMLDGSFKQFIKNNYGYFPKEFLNRIVYVN